jgi:alanine racemase
MVLMVKADAYGLGVAGTVRVLDAEDPWAFGVAAVGEGVTLRALGVTRKILVLSPSPPQMASEAVEHGLTLSISSADGLDALVKAAAAARSSADFHIEVDTGMGRAGFDWRHASKWGKAARQAHDAGVLWTGCFTHMHSADDNPASVDLQWRRFKEALDNAAPPDNGYDDDDSDGFIVHALNSAGAMRAPQYAADAVRPGIFLYGGGVGDDLPKPEEVASVRARIVHVRSAPAGTTLGYGSTYRSTKEERWATVSIGYGDGLPRALGNRGVALVHGQRVPIVGRISMDATVVSATRECAHCFMPVVC